MNEKENDDPVEELHGKFSFGKFAKTIWVFQIIFVVLYALFSEYGELSHPSATETEETLDIVQQRYPFYQDVHVMIFVGFGYLMVFLRSHGWSSLGFNFFVAAWTLQFTMLAAPFFH